MLVEKIDLLLFGIGLLFLEHIAVGVEKIFVMHQLRHVIKDRQSAVVVLGGPDDSAIRLFRRFATLICVGESPELFSVALYCVDVAVWVIVQTDVQSCWRRG